MASILDRIVEVKRQEVDAAQKRISLASIQQMAAAAPPPRDFFQAISDPKQLRLIAEIKKASPSKGILRADFDPIDIAKQYAEGGADALSVLTDESFFQGSLEYLKQVRQVVELPLLRKDFILDPYQVFEARAAGADAVLLIAECLTPRQLKELYTLARSLGMYALIELYDERLLPHVLDSGTEIVGVNNRNLHTFEVDLDHTVRLRSRVPSRCALVGESGIASSNDARKLWEAGTQAILVGETLMRQADLRTAVRDLMNFSS